MRAIFCILGVVGMILSPANAQNYDAMADFAQKICGDIPVGSLTKINIQGKIQANAGLLARIFAGTAGIDASRTDEIYKGIPFDKLPDKIPTTAMCKSELIKVIIGAGKLERSLEQQKTISDSMRKTMDYATAVAIIDRAAQTRNGSNQGQVAAIESLLAVGHSYSGVDFSGVAFERANLQGINFSEAELHFSIFRNSNLSGSNLNSSDFRFANLDGAMLANSDISKIFAPFISGRSTVFNHSNLRQANFFGADLRNADFRGADLTGASLIFADLRGADFSGANIEFAYLTGAFLEKANFTGARLKNTDLLAVSNKDSIFSQGQIVNSCRHAANIDGRINIELIERWPSDRFSSGYEYDHVNDFNQYYYFKKMTVSDLPLCAKHDLKPENFFGIEWIGFHLDRSYLSKQSRRNFSYEAVKQLFDRLDSYTK